MTSSDAWNCWMDWCTAAVIDPLFHLRSLRGYVEFMHNDHWEKNNNFWSTTYYLYWRLFWKTLLTVWPPSQLKKRAKSGNNNSRMASIMASITRTENFDHVLRPCLIGSKSKNVIPTKFKTQKVWWIHLTLILSFLPGLKNSLWNRLSNSRRWVQLQLINRRECTKLSSPKSCHFGRRNYNLTNTP